MIAQLPSGADGSAELWKLNHYYERLDDWNAAHGIAANPLLAPAAEPVFELHNLTRDPEERHNRVADGARRALPTRQRARRRARGQAAPPSTP